MAELTTSVLAQMKICKEPDGSRTVVAGARRPVGFIEFDIKSKGIPGTVNSISITRGEVHMLCSDHWRFVTHV